MRQRTRKLWGGILLLLFGGRLVARRHDGGAVGIGLGHWFTELVYYVVAGIGWVIPAGALVWWMAQPDRAA